MEKMRLIMEDMSVQGYGCTDIGSNRSINEDYYDMNDFLYVLADGIGGHYAGEIASKLAVKNIMKFIISINQQIFDKNNIINVQKIIQDAIIKTNEIIFKKSIQNIEFNGMGTTLVLASYQKPNTFHIANVGDSRAYLFRKGKLELLTQDHTIPQSMLRNGTITKEEVDNHPYRHCLTRSIGTSSKVRVYCNYFKVFPEDKILLCSDGLWDVLSEEQIVFLLKKNTSTRNICKNLVKKANEQKSNDNITSILIRVKKN